MNLYVFPESANIENGYRIGVRLDYERLLPKRENGDVVVWYTNDVKPIYRDTTDVVIKRSSLLSWKRFKNMLLNRLGPEMVLSELFFLKEKNFDNIFCGDVVSYRALKKIFPKRKMQVRLHNCFSRIYDRKKLLKVSVGLKYNLVLRAAYKLEQEIFLDDMVDKTFVSEEDVNYYNLMTGANDANVWSLVHIDEAKMNKNRAKVASWNYNKKLFWLGGVEAHKESSINWFINSVYPIIRREMPDVEFHLWGNKTLGFNNPKNCVYGHGFYDAGGMPFFGEGLYINPDIIGGGVKVKLKTYFEEGVPFISTPFGFEGCEKKLIDNKYCFVVETHLWANFIVELLKKK
jgi:hypothetical protein